MKFINIEGLDGSGKSTQIKLLKEHFEQKNIPFKYIHFPRTDSPVFGELIAKFLRGEFGDMGEVNPYLVALIYAGDRNDAKSMVREWLDNNYLVLIDRYVFSNIAFQCAKLDNANEIEKLSKWIKYLEFDYYKIPKPDISLFLDVPLDFTKKSLNKRRKGQDRDYLKGKDDIHEKDITFQRRVRDIYLHEIKEESFFHSIQCYNNNKEMLNPREIKKRILEFIQEI
jgi:dTMP kinase